MAQFKADDLAVENAMKAAPPQRVLVYCGSSFDVDPLFLDSARELGRLLARNGKTLVYGGGSSGSMGTLADGALEAGGKILGIIPHFMERLEWSHKGLTELRLVTTMHERKFAMMQESDGIVALPGGCGTFEELMEAISWKKLRLVTSPIIIVNLRGYFDPLVAMLERSIEMKFMSADSHKLWTVVTSVEGVISALESSTGGKLHTAPHSHS